MRFPIQILARIEAALEGAPLAKLCFIAAALVTLLSWFILRPDFVQNSVTDYQLFYRPVAGNVLGGQGLVTRNGQLATRYPPGYPLLLAGALAAGSALHLPEGATIGGLILVCASLTAMFIYLIASLIWQPQRALLAPAVAIFYPINLWLAQQPYSEVPAMTFMFAGLYCCAYSVFRRVRYALFALGGLLLGYSALIRPANIAIVLPLSVLILFFGTPIRPRSRILSSIVLVTSFACAVAPWEIYVYSRTSEVILLSTAGVPAIFDGLTYAVNTDNEYRPQISVPPDVEAVQKEVFRNKAQLHTVGAFFDLIRRQFFERPSGVVKLYLLKIARSWYATDAGKLDTIVLGIQVPYLIVALVSTACAWRRRSVYRRATVAVWSLVVYFWGMTTVALSISRYMVPAAMLLTLLTPALIPGADVGPYLTQWRKLKDSARRNRAQICGEVTDS